MIDDTIAFGALLNEFRKRQHITQQQLAEAIGRQRRAISRWEQGEGLPGNKAVVLELARHLYLDDEEARQLLEASLTSPAPLWGVTLPRNEFFTGREDILGILHRCLCIEQTRAFPRAIALTGLGGIGKTQTALEYAYQHALEYRAIFWIEAESLEHILFSLQRIAELLQLPERLATEQRRIIDAVQRWFATHDHWLVIWDNLEDLELPFCLLPVLRQGALLFTTRQQALGTFAQSFNLRPLMHEEGTSLLLRRAKRRELEMAQEQMLHQAETPSAEYSAASKLVTLLGGLPLALDQVGAYIEDNGCSLVDYLQRYEMRQVDLLDRRGEAGSYHPQPVTTTFLLACAQVEQTYKEAADLLRVCAFLYAEAIPAEIFRLGSVHLEPTLAALVSDPIQFDLMLAALRRLSLIQRHAETNTLSLHRLLQVVVREQMDSAEERLWCKCIVQMMNTIFPAGDDIATWDKCERYLSQALACVPLIEKAENALLEAVELLSKIGRYLTHRGRLEEAEPLIARAVSLNEQQYNSDHPTLILPLMVQAEFAWRQGNFAFAEESLWRVLALEERQEDSAAISIANTVNLLALYCWEQGKYGQAEQLYQQALRTWEQQTSPDHPDTALLLHHLALLYWKQGQYKQARTLYEQALDIFERVMSVDHPHIAFPLIGLAALYEELGEYTQARSLFQQTLRIREQAFGPDHPVVAYSLNGLARIGTRQGEYAQAELLYQRSLRIRKQALGFDHPEISYTLSGMAKLYVQQGACTQAESLFQQALCIREQALGSDHPEIASLLNNLARLYGDQGYYARAMPLFQRTLQIREQRLGASHLKTARTLVALASLYEKQGEEKQAESSLQRAYSIFTHHLGCEHPEAVKTRNSYHALIEKRKAPGVSSYPPYKRNNGTFSGTC